MEGEALLGENAAHGVAHQVEGSAVRIVQLGQKSPKAGVILQTETQAKGLARHGLHVVSGEGQALRAAQEHGGSGVHGGCGEQGGGGHRCGAAAEEVLSQQQSAGVGGGSAVVVGAIGKLQPDPDLCALIVIGVAVRHLTRVHDDVAQEGATADPLPIEDGHGDGGVIAKGEVVPEILHPDGDLIVVAAEGIAIEVVRQVDGDVGHAHGEFGLGKGATAADGEGRLFYDDKAVQIEVQGLIILVARPDEAHVVGPRVLGPAGGSGVDGHLCPLHRGGHSLLAPEHLAVLVEHARGIEFAVIETRHEVHGAPLCG